MYFQPDYNFPFHLSHLLFDATGIEHGFHYAIPKRDALGDGGFGCDLRLVDTLRVTRTQGF